MEPSGRNRWQPVANGTPQKPPKQAEPQPVATHGNRFGAHGKEGVNGSSPLEGFRNSLQNAEFRSFGRQHFDFEGAPGVHLLPRERCARLADGIFGTQLVAAVELGGWDLPVDFEEAAVVEPVDPFEGRVFEVVEAAPGAAVANELGFVEPDDRLGERVVVGVAPGSGRVDGACFGEAFGVADREILHAPVGVMDQLVEPLPAAGARPDRLLKRVQGEVGAERPGGLPADRSSASGRR